MPAPVFTLDTKWRDHYLAGLICVHHLRGLETDVETKKEPTLEVLVQLLADLAAGTYKSDQYVTRGRPGRYTLQNKPPPLTADVTYTLLAVNGITATGEFVSVPTGGVAFEDPFLAIVAAHVLQATQKPLLGVPKAKDNEELWRRPSQIEADIMKKTFEPRKYLGEIKGFVAPAKSAEFKALDVRADQVQALRSRGIQTLPVNKMPHFYQLYEKS